MNKSLMLAIEKSVVAICHSRPALENIVGTGFIASPEGLVITADHVIVDELTNDVYKSIFCLRPDHPKVDIYELSLVKRFREGIRGRDIAVLRINQKGYAEHFSFIPLGKGCEIGDNIIIAGFPLVFDKVYTWPLFRRGVIASTRFHYEDTSIMVLDLGVIEGFSGSPVIDLETSKVIGIMRGEGKRVKNSGFSVASSISENDIAQLGSYERKNP